MITKDASKKLLRRLSQICGNFRLDLSQASFKSEDVFSELIYEIANLPSLTDLRLPSLPEPLHDDLISLIESSSTLRSLSLSSLDTHRLPPLALATQWHGSLARLDLSGNPLGARGAEALGRSLGAMSSLSVLSLSQCQINDAGLQNLCYYLEENRSVTALDLSRNAITSGGTPVLGSWLRYSSTIASLNLSHNRLNAEGSQDLVLSLTVNKSLRSLQLRNICPDDKCIRYVTPLLRFNASLHNLDLQRNKISDRYLGKLTKALSENPSLLFFDIRHNAFDLGKCFQACQRLNSFLTRNRLRRMIQKLSLQEWCVIALASAFPEWEPPFFDPIFPEITMIHFHPFSLRNLIKDSSRLELSCRYENWAQQRSDTWQHSLSDSQSLSSSSSPIISRIN